MIVNALIGLAVILAVAALGALASLAIEAWACVGEGRR